MPRVLQAAAGGRLRQAVSALRNSVGAFKVKVGDIEFGIEPAPGRADTGNLEHDLPDLIEAVATAKLHSRCQCLMPS